MKLSPPSILTLIRPKEEKNTISLLLISLVLFSPVFVLNREFSYFFNQGPTIVLFPAALVIIVLAVLRGTKSILIDDFAVCSLVSIGLIILHCAILNLLAINWIYISFMLIWILFYLLYQPSPAKKDSFPSWLSWLFQLMLLSQLLLALTGPRYGNYKLVAGFDNPNQFSQFLVSLSIFSILNLVSFSKSKAIRTLSVLNILGVLTVIAVNGSRTSILAFIVITALILGTSGKYPRYILVITTCFLLSGFTFFLIQKSDSSNGRLLAYKITLRTLGKSPFFGYGFNKFQKIYNDEQAAYFTTEREGGEKLLAGNVNYAYNEILQLAVEIGVVPTIGLLSLFLWYYYKSWLKVSANSKGEVSLANLAVLTALAIFAMFNFPLHSYSFLIIILMISVLAKQEAKPRSVRWPYLLHAVVLALCVPLSFFSIRYLGALSAYRKIQKQDSVNSKSAMALFERLRSNEYFLYNSALRLNEAGDFTSSNRLLHELLKTRTSYDIYELLGDNLLKQGSLANAKVAYLKASQTIPGKFRVKYKLMVLSQQTGHLADASFWAKCIVSMPVKIQSVAIADMKAYAKLFISNYNKKQ